MTVSTEIITHSYFPGAAMQPEAIPFPYIDGDHIVVSIAGVEGALVAGVDYVLGGDGRTKSGIITALKAFDAEAELVLRRATPMLQEVLTEAFKPLPAEAIGRELDRRAMVDQEIADDLSRAPKLPRHGSAAGKFPVALPAGGWGWSFGTGADLGLRTDLADEAGTALIGFRPPSADAITRTLRSKLLESVSIVDFGAVADEETYNSAAILAAISYLDSVGGGHLVIPNGDFLVDETISPVITKDLVIEFRGGKLIAASGLSDPVLFIKGAPADQAEPNDINLRVIGPNIDCSAGDSPIIGNTYCSALAFNYLKTVRVEGGYLYGGENPSNLNADSGVSWVTCGEVVVDGVTIRGFNDCGIYPNGNNTGGDGGTGRILNCTIQRCHQAVQAKRQLKHLQFGPNNVVEECNSGVQASPVTSPFNVKWARRVDIFNNIFRKVRTDIARFAGDVEGSFKENKVIDWGYAYDGTNSAGINAVAISFFGAREINVERNIFARKEWAADNQVAYRFQNYSFDGVNYTHGACVMSGNSYRHIPRIVTWAANGDSHIFSDEYFDDITGNITDTTYLNANTEITYRMRGKYGLWHRRNNILTQMAPPRTEDGGNGLTLTNDDAGTLYTNTSATAVSTFVLPEASANFPGDFTFVRVSASHNLTIKAQAGDNIRIPGATSTSGGTITTTAPGDMVKLRAVSSSLWVCEAIGGSWTAA